MIKDSVEYFYKKRWPNGFECPRCGCNQYYTISTRRLPLYQCRWCKLQTTVTSGTVMDKSRTPLEKWAAALELLSAADGVNAVQLSTIIGVTHKVAWSMLRRIRQAISEAESSRLLDGQVEAGFTSTGRIRRGYFTNRLKSERILLVAGELDSRIGRPAALKFMNIAAKQLDYRLLQRLANIDFRNRHVQSEAVFTLPKRIHLHMFHPLYRCFLEARRWINRRFRGLRMKYYQTYLDEFCFRYNTAMQHRSLKDELFRVCLSDSAQRYSLYLR